METAQGKQITLSIWWRADRSSALSDLRLEIIDILSRGLYVQYDLTAINDVSIIENIVFYVRSYVSNRI